MNRLRILIVLLAFVAACIYYAKEQRMPTTYPEGEGALIDKDWLTGSKEVVTPKNYQRAADNTFWVYPEWYLVHSPAEQAEYFKTHTATTMAYVGHSEQFWDSYHLLAQEMDGHFDFNMEYYTMVMVIGGSTSVEYLMKAWYEKVIGRLTDTGSPMTEEDQFNAQYMQDYVDFIRKEPWFNFDYLKRLKHLWTHTSWMGDYCLRKWERKYVLTSELLFKAAYGKLMKMGSTSVFGEERPQTIVLTNQIPKDMGPTASLIEVLADSTALIALPRYAAFVPAVVHLANQDIQVKEVAGNASAILISILSSKDIVLDLPHCQVLFRQPILSKETQQRVVLVTPVPSLCQTLKTLQEKGLIIEHIYDF